MQLKSHSTKAGVLPPGVDPLLILVVDDDPDCRLLICDAIESSGMCCRVYEACNGLEALDFLHGRPPFEDVPKPGLIFLDVEMPGMGGQETLRAIRSTPQFAETPVVIMTGVSDERQMRQAAANGANSYTLKPASGEQFLQTVQKSTNYWLTVHQYPHHRMTQDSCRR